jgi:hypothetical protein
MNKQLKIELNKLSAAFHTKRLKLLKMNDMKSLENLNRNYRIARELIISTFGDDLTRINKGEEIVIK